MNIICKQNFIEHSLNFFISFQLVDINEGFLSLMMDNGDVREDLRVPEGDLGKEIETKHGAGEDMMVSRGKKNPGKFCFSK